MSPFNLIIVAAFVALLATFVCSWQKVQQSITAARVLGETLFANIGEGTHIKAISRLPDAAIGTRFLIAKAGSDAFHANICDATSIPLGIWLDETGSTTDLTIPRAIALLGASDETRRVAINSTVTAGDLLVSDASGYARTLPAAGAVPATYYGIGRALQSGVAGDVIEFDPDLLFIDLQAASGTVTLTSSTVATVNASDLATAVTLVNALKTQVNNLVADAAAIKTASGI